MRQGYLRTTDYQLPQHVSHSAGRLGQGFDVGRLEHEEYLNYKYSDKDIYFPAFTWSIFEVNKTPGMLVSLFPNAEDDTGLNSAGRLIEI